MQFSYPHSLPFLAARVSYRKAMAWIVPALLLHVVHALAQGLVAPITGIQTTSGKILGVDSPKMPGVSQFLGIPFAQPPTGANRWLRPQNYNSTAEFRAVKQAASCRGSITMMSGSNIGEDCLYLNVWAPNKGEGNKPVLVFIYGGGFETGTTAGTDGSRLASRGDVVVVVPA